MAFISFVLFKSSEGTGDWKSMHAGFLCPGYQGRQRRTLGRALTSKSHCQGEHTLVVNDFDVIRLDRGMSLGIIFNVVSYS